MIEQHLRRCSPDTAGGRDAINDAVEAAAEEAMRRRTALAEARKDAKAARDKQRDEELKRLMKECALERQAITAIAAVSTFFDMSCQPDGILRVYARACARGCNCD